MEYIGSYQMIISLGALALILIIASMFKIVREYERAVVFRFGRLIGAKGPGLVFLLPLIDRVVRVELRTISIDVPRQEIMTKDNVPATVDAVVYYHVIDPVNALMKVTDIYQSTFLIAQTSLRSILGQVDLDELLSQQEKINQQLCKIIDKHTNPWGIEVSIVEIKEVSLPEEMKRAMARQAETERERRAKIIYAEAEYQSAEKLAQAAKIISQDPSTMQLRYLQTLSEISSQNSHTMPIVFPFPMELVKAFMKLADKKTDSCKE